MNDKTVLTKPARWKWPYLTIFAVAAAVGITFVIYLFGSPPRDDQMSPTAAYLDLNGDGAYLVAWGDLRGLRSDIVGAIVHPRNTKVRANFPIAVNEAGQRNASAAANPRGKDFLVVWEDEREGAQTSISAVTSIYGQRVTSDGKLAGTNFAISSTDSDNFNPAVAYCSNRNQYLVVWDDRRKVSLGMTNDIFGQLVDANGKLIGTALQISPTPGNQSFPSIAYNPADDEFLVVWEELPAAGTTSWDILGQRVGCNGQLNGPPFGISQAPNVQVRPAVAYNAESKRYLVAWSDLRGQTTSLDHDIYGQLVIGGATSASGNLDGGNFPISTAKNDQDGHVRVAAGADSFLVTFSDERKIPFQRDIYAQRVNPSGKLLGGNFPISDAADAQQWSAVAYSTSDQSYFVAWGDWRSYLLTQTDIYGQHVALNGNLLLTTSSKNFTISVRGIVNPVKP